MHSAKSPGLRWGQKQTWMLLCAAPILLSWRMRLIPNAF
jgi:hypothetical protein